MLLVSTEPFMSESDWRSAALFFSKTFRMKFDKSANLINIRAIYINSSQKTFRFINYSLQDVNISTLHNTYNITYKMQAQYIGMQKRPNTMQQQIFKSNVIQLLQ